MNFEKVDKKYRPIPFWSWNSKLESEETLRQIDIMDKCGMGGFFMHARGGLDTEYMSDEWFEQIRISALDARARGMYPWAYDENGWPSGFGGGKVNGLGDFYRQKTLNIIPCGENATADERTVLIKDGYKYFYTVNPFYVDITDAEVVKKFIEVVYEEYHKRVGDIIEGFFTDEPQMLRETGFPWSLSLEDEFKAAYGYSLIDNLDKLFFDIAGHEQVRVDYWKLMTERLMKNYFGQIYSWCESRGYKFTGHLTNEEWMLEQTLASGTSMPHYEYFSIPGIDWLTDKIYDNLAPRAIGSAAAQLGKKQVITESYGAAGHQLTIAEMKRIYEWQMVRGVNLLCTHLEGYTLKGIRKRDFPPAMFYQQPWWDDFATFTDTVSRIGMILAEGKECSDTLIIHPQTQAWRIYNGTLDSSTSFVRRIKEIERRFLNDVSSLERKHILFHFGDEILMERHARVVGSDLVVGEARYTRVIVPEYINLLPTTRALLEEYKRAGGTVLYDVEGIAPNPITEENALTYTKREYEDFTVHYFVNSTEGSVSATFARGNYILDQTSGRLLPFFGSYSFEPYESIVLIDTYEPRARCKASPTLSELSLSGTWELKGAPLNSITLDRCDYSIDGGKVVKDGYVLDILPRVNELRRPARVWQRYTFSAEVIPSELYLAIETPEIFTVKLGGREIEKREVGYFIDKSFRLIDIKPYTVIGENEIELECTVSQSEKTYKHLSESFAFETMVNSLSYDMEIEPIYLVGDFGAKISRRRWVDDRIYTVRSQPTVVAKPKTVDSEQLDKCGYSEFAGTLEISKTFTLAKGETNRYITLNGYGISTVSVTVNGQDVCVKMFPPYKIDVSEYLKVGKNEITLKISNNLRNMQGPLHKVNVGWGVCPGSFYREQNVFHHPEGATESCHAQYGEFVDGYVLHRFGLICDG